MPSDNRTGPGKFPALTRRQSVALENGIKRSSKLARTNPVSGKPVATDGAVGGLTEVVGADVEAVETFRMINLCAGARRQTWMTVSVAATVVASGVLPRSARLVSSTAGAPLRQGRDKALMRMRGGTCHGGQVTTATRRTDVALTALLGYLR